MKRFLISAITIICFFLTTQVEAATAFRGIIVGLDEEECTAEIKFYGNPDIQVGIPLYVHNYYGKTKATLTLMDLDDDIVTAKAATNFDELQCGNYVTSYQATDHEAQEQSARHVFNVKIKYDKTPRLYNVLVDKEIEFDRYLDFVWIDGSVYRIDTENVAEIQLNVVGDTLNITGLVTKDQVINERERIINVSQQPQDLQPWQNKLIPMLKGMVVTIENNIEFTYKDIVSIELDERGDSVDVNQFVKQYIINEDEINRAMEEANTGNDNSPLQTEEIITAYPVIFTFDRYRLVISELQKQINEAATMEVPDIEQINRLWAMKDYLENNLQIADIESVYLVIEDPRARPIKMQFKGNKWQTKVNLTRGTYKYHYEIKVRAKPCDLSFIVEDPSPAVGQIEVFTQVIPVEVRDRRVSIPLDGSL